MNNKLKLLSLFSGIGAPESALSRLGISYKLIGFSEVDPWAIKSYCAIHDVEESLNLGDISAINPKDLPDFDLVTLGFPCTSLSRAGLQEGIGIRCEQCNHEFSMGEGIGICPECNSHQLKSHTESGLLLSALRIIKYKLPKYFLIENVKGLVGKRFKKDFDFLLNHLITLGYNVNWEVLNATDFNIPQNRERVFIIGIRNDIPKEFSFPQPVPLTKNLKEVLQPDAELPILHNIYGGFKERKPRIFTEYSPTIRTAKGGGHIPSVVTLDKDKIERVVGEYNTRQLTPLETWRLQDFSDDDFLKAQTLGMSATQLYKQSGNSIPVGVLVLIFEKLLKG